MTVVFITAAESDFESLFLRYAKISRLDIKRLPEIKKTATGKPYFTSGGIHFSVSHSKDVKLTAFSDREIGVDIEFLDETRNFKRISERFFKKTERPKNITEFFELFTRKEAFIKEQGETLAKKISETPPDYSKNYNVLKNYAVAVATTDTNIFFVADKNS